MAQSPEAVRVCPERCRQGARNQISYFMRKRDEISLCLENVLLSSFVDMMEVLTTLRDCFPGSPGTSYMNSQSSSGTWTRVGVLDGQSEADLSRLPAGVSAFPDMDLADILEEAAKLLFPTSDRTVDADVVVRQEGRSVEFCIAGHMRIENAARVYVQLLQMLRQLRKSDEE